MSVSFVGQIKEVSTKTLVDLSKTTKVTLFTEDMSVLELNAFPADKLIKIVVSIEE